ncbi:hypothetical protein K402DRAFT_300358, partial [Aulographum hederae CBS 113979]
PSRRRAHRQSSMNNNLKLPSLPRFHPANFPSQHSSMATTPTSGGASPQPPMSPRTQQRQHSEAQMQLYSHQREILAAAVRASARTKPPSPQLMPLAGSPGPVTPLELEGQSGGYFMTGTTPGTSQAEQQDYVERLIREEAQRQ